MEGRIIIWRSPPAGGGLRNGDGPMCGPIGGPRIRFSEFEFLTQRREDYETHGFRKIWVLQVGQITVTVRRIFLRL